jgi:hypothetical protein
MILPPEVGRAIDHCHGRRLFHDAQKGWIPPRVAADGTRLLLGEVATLIARVDSLADGGEDRSQPLGLFGSLLEEMKSESLRRLPAYPREPGKFRDKLLYGAHRSEWRRKRQLWNLPHLGLKHFRRPALSLGHGGKHQLAQEFGIAVREDSGVDRDGAHGATAISGDLDHATSGRRFDGTRSQLRLKLLKPALHLLAQLEQLLKICHAIG